MTGFSIPEDKSYLSLENNRHVNVTPPWFTGKSKYPPRAGVLIEPLINGERAFGAVYDAINNAKKSICIISWGFDPSMRLKPSRGERLGELLNRKAEKDHVETRILVWKNWFIAAFENNLPGDGLFGGGGNTGLGSGVGGQTSAGGGSSSTKREEFNAYGSGGRNSAAVNRGDDEAKRFNRDWFNYHPPWIDFRTRDFNKLDHLKVYYDQMKQHGTDNLARTYAMGKAASHHQKMILIDYELPEHAVGFVMGHNLMRDYWDTDAHEYHSETRQNFRPWQDVSCRVYGGVLFDLNENFSTAWDSAESFLPIDEKRTNFEPIRDTLKPADFEKAAKSRGKTEVAQITRTQPEENTEKSILHSYQLALCNARNYIYFENQYFRYKEFPMLLRANRRALKQAKWNKDFYVFAVINVPDDKGRFQTYEMLKAFGKSDSMPKIDKLNEKDNAKNPDQLRKADLEGVNIHICTLEACANTPQGMKYTNIYVHSKLLLVDDIFFTLGSANVNARSMESDSEIAIACPSPALTKQWRDHLWKIHTKQAPLEDMKSEFERWGKIMAVNAIAKATKKSLVAPLIEFFDDADSAKGLD